MGCVEQFTPPVSNYENLLVVEAVFRAVRMSVNATVPLPRLQPRDGVEAGVAVGDLGGGQGAGQVHVAAQVEEIDVEIGDHGWMRGIRLLRVEASLRSAGRRRSDPRRRI